MTDTHTTAHIPDEAVQVFKKEFHENSPQRSYNENIKASLTAALPHLSAPCADKPIDVAAVRETLEDLVLPIVGHLFVARGGATVRGIAGLEHGEDESSPLVRLSDVTKALEPFRALSPAEPAQGEQWRDIKSAPVSNGSQTFLTYITGHGSSVCYKTPSGHICSNSTGKIIHRATHWMPLPAAPTSEAGK